MERIVFIISLILTFSGVRAQGIEARIPEMILSDPDYRLATRCVARYAELTLAAGCSKADSLLMKAQQDGFRFEVGHPSDLSCIPQSASFGIGFNGREYEIKWSEEDRIIVKCVFPANIQLLSFKDKYSLDNELLEVLESAECSAGISMSFPNDSILEKIPFSDCFLLDKGFFITPRLKHQISYLKTEENSSSCQLLIDFDKYPLETVSNIMLSGCSSPQFELDIVMRGKDGKRGVKIGFADFYRIMVEEGCFPYWGIDKFDGENIKGVYVWINKFGGYAHVLSVTASIGGLMSGNSSKATLSSFIRLDNLKTLVEEMN